MAYRPKIERYEDIEERLKKEKTIVSEPRFEEQLLRQLCPLMPKIEEDKSQEIKLKIIQKVMKEISGKIKANQYSIVFDESRTRSSGYPNTIFNSDEIEIIFPIRRAINTVLSEISPEYFILKGPEPDKTLKVSNEVFSSQWIENEMEWIFSAEKVCKVIYIILDEAFRSLEESIPHHFKKNNFVFETENNSFVVNLQFNKEYLNTDFKEKPLKSEEGHKENKDLDITSVPVSSEQSNNIDIIESEGMVYDINIKTRIIPSITINVKEKEYIISKKPNNQAKSPEADHLMRHSWFRDCYWKEQSVISKICAADKSTRLFTSAALQRLCLSEPDLRFLTNMQFFHNLILEVDQNVDDVTSCWQRKTFFECFCNQLECLRNQLKQNGIINYFNNHNNLVDRDLVEKGIIKKAFQKLDIFARSKSSLIRYINEILLQ